MTPDQLTAMRAACIANPTANAFIVAEDANGLLAWLNTASGQNAWHSSAPVANIIDAIDWTKYTPADAVSSSDSGDTLSRKNGWLLTIQTKQMNLQLMLQGREFLNAAKPVLRAGLRDATTTVPAGSGGAAMSPGGASGATVLASCMRPALNGEMLLATGTSTTGSSTAYVLTFEGQVSPPEATAIVFP